MLHEFLVVDLAIPIDVCKQVQGEALLRGKSKLLNLYETSLVFVPFKESIRVTVTIPELCEQSDFVVFWHNDVGNFEMTELDQLCLTS